MRLENKIKEIQWTFAPYFAPLFIAVYILFLYIVDNPASLTRIDPEYLCLLNGLNVSIFQFDNIGYTDLPGTPFLVLTGIFIRITHILFGANSIVDDVLLRPDFYIQSASYLLLLVTVIILIWGGKSILKTTKSIFAMVVLQSSFLLSPVCFNLQVRYNADRLLPLLVFIFAVYTISYLYNSIGSRKYALLSGIILGVGFITKFNFVVLAIIPVFILGYKYWLTYIGTYILSAFISFLPIIDKFQNVKSFITRLLLYEGSYGGGSKGVLNFEQLIYTVKKVPVLNDSFAILFVLAVLVLFFFLLKYKNRKGDIKKLLFLLGFVLAAIFEIILASKSFKNYYLVPVLGLLGICFFIIWDLIVKRWNINKKWSTYAGAILFVALIIPTIIQVNALSEFTKERLEKRKETVEFVKNNIRSSDYLFLEPAWISGPIVENGLLFGISYVAGKNDFSKQYLKYYPNILSYEGDNKPIKHFRTKDANIESIFKEDNFVYLFSTPGRNTKKLLIELEKQARMVNMNILPDTVFINQQNKDIFIKTGFKKISNSVDSIVNTISFFNNMEGQEKYWSQNALVKDKSFSGSVSSKIESGNKTSPVFDIDPTTVISGKLSALIISCKYFQTNFKNKTRIIIDISEEKSNRFWYPVYCSDYFDKINVWNDFSYKIYLPENLRDANHIRVYFYNNSKNQVYLDDISIKLVQSK